VKAGANVTVNAGGYLLAQAAGNVAVTGTATLVKGSGGGVEIHGVPGVRVRGSATAFVEAEKVVIKGSRLILDADWITIKGQKIEMKGMVLVNCGPDTGAGEGVSVDELEGEKPAGGASGAEALDRGARRALGESGADGAASEVAAAPGEGLASIGHAASAAGGVPEIGAVSKGGAIPETGAMEAGSGLDAGSVSAAQLVADAAQLAKEKTAYLLVCVSWAEGGDRAARGAADRRLGLSARGGSGATGGSRDTGLSLGDSPVAARRLVPDAVAGDLPGLERDRSPLVLADLGRPDEDDRDAEQIDPLEKVDDSADLQLGGRGRRKLDEQRLRTTDEGPCEGKPKPPLRVERSWIALSDIDEPHHVQGQGDLSGDLLRRAARDLERDGNVGEDRERGGGDQARRLGLPPQAVHPASAPRTSCPSRAAHGRRPGRRAGPLRGRALAGGRGAPAPLPLAGEPPALRLLLSTAR
jgi:hypothetical protein